MSATETPAAGASNAPELAGLIKSVSDRLEEFQSSIRQHKADKDDLAVLNKTVNETVADLKKQIGEISVKVTENDVHKKYHGLPFASGAHFFQTFVKAQRGDEDAKKLMFGDGGYVKRMDVIADQVYKAPSGFHTQSNEGEIFILPEWSNELLRTPSSRSGIYDRCGSFSMTGNLYRVRALVDKNHTSSVSGGITVARTAEGGASTATTADFEFVEFRPNKLTGLTYITEEMLEDATAFATLIPGLFAEAFASQDEEDVLFGSGVGEPLGMLNDSNPSLISVTRNTAASIKIQDILNMRARAVANNWGNYVWIGSQDIIPQLGVLSNANQTLYLSNAKTGEAFDTILGRPLLYSDHVATLGTKTDLSLVDPTQYRIAMKGGITQQQSIHVRFLYGETTLRFVKRNDGQPLWRAALQPKKSTQSTRSPFITIAT